MSSLELLNIPSSGKLGAVQNVAEYFFKAGFKIVDLDVHRPWGFFFYFDKDQTEQFVSRFFGNVKLEGIDSSLPLQPKVLVFEPGKRLSWQYHNRRSEIWRCVTDECQIIMSQTNEQGPSHTIKFGEVVNYTQGTRHRGGAPTNNWGAVAEIWQHSDPANPSDEDDIVRLQDDFGRN